MSVETRWFHPLRRRWLATCLLMLLIATALPVGAAPGLPTAKVEATLAQRLHDAGQAPVLIFLAGQADLSQAAYLVKKEAKGAFVYAQLKDFAERSQASLRAELTQRGIAYQAFLSVNMIYLPAADLTLVNELAARDDVRWLTLDASFGIDPSEQVTQPVDAPAVISSGVNYIRAPQVWAMGIDGAGIVVAGGDTGVRWTHEALKPQYRGWNGVSADHTYSWHDAIHDGGANPCGLNVPAPCDDYFHGTHTIGSVAGDDHSAIPATRDQIGVAPGTKWIACRNMNAGVGTISRYVECNDFFLAPGDDTSKQPDVVNNSWGCPASEGCDSATWTQIQPSIQALNAAGVMFVASAGNDGGQGCGSINDPPAVYPESLSVGNFYDGTGVISGSSSRGLRDFTGLFGPDVSAPGTSIRSATNSSDTGYTSASGTSMAGPHVAGLVALMWQANPALRGQILETAQYIRETATRVDNITCGVLTPYPDPLDNRPTPNNVYGWGRIDALNAVNAVRCPTDIDYDGGIDIRDVQLVAEIWNTQPGQALYNARRNLDFSDPAITTTDVTAVVGQWGVNCTN